MNFLPAAKAAMKLSLLAFALVAPRTDVANAQAAATEPDPFADVAADRTQPISVSADQGTANFETETAVYSGNVVVTQGDLILRADTLTIKAPDGAIASIEAEGGIVLTSESGDATAARATYDVPARRVTLAGSVVLTQGDNVLRGSRLTVNLDSGVAELTASGADGRVEGLFLPPPETTPETTPDTTPATGAEGTTPSTNP